MKKHVPEERKDAVPGLPWDAHDHTPQYKNCSRGKKPVRHIGENEVGVKENADDAKNRYSIVWFATSDGQTRKPDVCFKGERDAKRFQDIKYNDLPKHVTFRGAPKATYDTRATADLLWTKYPPPKNGNWRGCVYDQWNCQVLLIYEFDRESSR